MAELGETRKLILASDLDKERKLDLLHSLASREAFEAAVAELPELAAQRRGCMKGKVYLVGAGPGDPELLTVKALRLLQSAEAVLLRRLVAPRF